MVVKLAKKLFPFKFKRKIKEHLGVPSLHWSLQNLKKKNFNPAVILDVGAYQGLWTLDILEVFPSAKVLLIEAQHNKAPYLEAIKQKYPNVNYAIELLSSTDGADILFEENETASHVVVQQYPGMVYQKKKARSLDALLQHLNFPLPDFLKLDVQGHEMDVLIGAEQTLSHATVVLLEVSFLNIGDDTPLLGDMLVFMDKHNFQAYDITQLMRRPFDKALYQADVFFVKKDSRLVADKKW